MDIVHHDFKLFKDNLREHELSHNTINCVECGTPCLSQSILKCHRRKSKKCKTKCKRNNSVALNRGQFHCSGCNKKFTDKSSLRRHQKFSCKGNTMF